MSSGVPLALLLLLFPSTVPVDTVEAIRTSLWKVVFELDVSIAGHHTALSNISLGACANLCLSTSGCRSFQYLRVNATCRFYDHLVLYTGIGTAAPGTRYYWLHSPRCPTERGYVLEQGVCFKVYQILLNATDARDKCHEDGAHLMITDTVEKENAAYSHAGTVRLWVGASDVENEGQWWWVDGTPIEHRTALWYPNRPDAWSGENNAAVDPRMEDVRGDWSFHLVCQIPM